MTDLYKVLDASTARNGWSIRVFLAMDLSAALFGVMVYQRCSASAYISLLPTRPESLGDVAWRRAYATNYGHTWQRRRQDCKGDITM